MKKIISFLFLFICLNANNNWVYITQESEIEAAVKDLKSGESLWFKGPLRQLYENHNGLEFSLLRSVVLGLGLEIYHFEVERQIDWEKHQISEEFLMRVYRP